MVFTGTLVHRISVINSDFCIFYHFLRTAGSDDAEHCKMDIPPDVLPQHIAVMFMFNMQ